MKVEELITQTGIVVISQLNLKLIHSITMRRIVTHFEHLLLKCQFQNLLSLPTEAQVTTLYLERLYSIR